MGDRMTITLPPQLQSLLADRAQRRGISPESLAIEVLQRQLMPLAPPAPTDEWERRLFSIAIDCGVSVPDSALSSDGLYD